MKYTILLLFAFILLSCNINKKEKAEKVTDKKSANIGLSPNKFILKSDSLYHLLEKGEIEPGNIIETKIIKLNNGKSFNEFINPVNVNDILIGLTSREELLEKMGAPDSISKEANFVGDDGGLEERFWYKNSHFRTFDGKVQTIELADPEFVVNGFLNVGMSEQVIKKLFPVSYSQGRKAEDVWRYEGKGYDMEYAIFRGDNLLSIVTKDGKIARMVFIYSV
ncbi:hypothetical protein [Draconibacterium sp.]|uniref:hypothetical protein n=1 Tax=Draconibacterium sp. TaxID=1965318 RepID=UPI0035657096